MTIVSLILIDAELVRAVQRDELAFFEIPL